MNMLKRTANKVLLTPLILGLMITTSTVSVATANTGEAFFHESKHAHKRMKKMAMYLALTDEQRTQIKAIKSAAKADNSALREEVKDFKTQVKSLKDSSTFDEQAFSASYVQYQDTFAQLALTKAKTRHAIFQVLTTEQQEKWQLFMEKKKQKRQAK